MRWSQCFIPTLRESPAGVETSAERLLVRAGYARAVSAGVYGYLPLGMRSLARLQRIAREELARIGGQQVLLDPDAAGEIARGELRSAKQLPQVWFRMQTPLWRVRQLAGLDVYSFGLEPGALQTTLAKIVHRAGAECTWSKSGAVALLDGDPDSAAVCPSCHAASALALAESQPVPAPGDLPGDLSPELFPTPGQKTIADLSRFTGQPESMQMKSLVLVAAGKPVLVMLRGDHQLSEAKFAARSGDAKFRQASPDELVRWMGASAGSLGPVGVTTMPVWIDRALEGRRNMVCGANRDDYHLRHVTPGEDFQAETADLRETAAGDLCANCGAALEIRPALELARISGDFAVLSVERLLALNAETSNDKDGLILPPALAPFDVIVVDAGAPDTAAQVYRALAGAGCEVLLDDRDERAGVKFKDADLIGIPWRVTAGKKAADGLVEVVERRTHTRTDVPVDGIIGVLSGR
jgi:prolyl-tRNA synthetase